MSVTKITNKWKKKKVHTHIHTPNANTAAFMGAGGQESVKEMTGGVKRERKSMECVFESV